LQNYFQAPMTAIHPLPPIAESENETLEVIGARVHNLKDISVSIPRNKLVVITGLSGSGKSSLAFDTIYAEGQRRYIETFSAYARQFLGDLERPDVDKITGLSPVISIEQKTVNKNPRSTVGTITEIYDFLRLLYARASDAYSFTTGEKMVRYSDEQIIDLILSSYQDKKVLILSPVVKGRKGHYRELFEHIRKLGFLRARVDGALVELTTRIQLDRYKVHDIEIVIDRIQVNSADRVRITDSVKLALKHGKGAMMVADGSSTKGTTKEARHFSRNLMCPTSGISYNDPAPNIFSFNSPYGACTKCNGLGHILEIDIDKIIPVKTKSIKSGGIIPIGEYRSSWIFKQLDAIADKYKFKLSEPINNIPEEALNAILFGTAEMLKVKNDSNSNETSYSLSFEGVVNFLARQEHEGATGIQKWAQEFMNETACPKCNGTRLKKESLYFRVADKNIAELASMSLTELKEWLNGIEDKISERQRTIGNEVLKEIKNRLQFLLNVGLDYLSIDRTSRSLSGGEAQRIRLATQIGSQLVGVLYILDEPSIGLHQRDNVRLIQALKELRDIGNSVIVVEHDKEMILTADHVIDIGPRAGIHGGYIVAEGKPSELLKFKTLTTDYITGLKQIQIPSTRRNGNGKYLILDNCSGHNLKNVTVEIPLGKFICVTGVSGSGKSSLINETLYPILSKHFYRSQQKALPYKKIHGLEHIDKVIEIDQSPIGRTPRSNPATYTNVFSDIRTLFSELQESKIRGYKPGRFSFNVKGGRCETCQGAGLRTIEMNFLPDVYVFCEACNGKRYNRETLEIRYKGKSISDVLQMTIDSAVSFFEFHPTILARVKAMQDVGLGYITLGQQSTTLSGGEAQRVKLATELARKQTGNTLYILDEPTTGLHFDDIRILLEVLDKLVDQGNTVLVIEHNMDIIKVADHIIDLGPEGGIGGGEILAVGTPELVAKNLKSFTAKYLREELNNGVHK
jgi:excinuclease ABC subunit A